MINTLIYSVLGDAQNCRSANRNCRSANRNAPHLPCSSRRLLKASPIFIELEYARLAVFESCKPTKKKTLWILGHVILDNIELIQICNSFLQFLRAAQSPTRARSRGVFNREPRSIEAPFTEGASTIVYLLEVISSITLLPPLDEDIGGKAILAVSGARTSSGNFGHSVLFGGQVIIGPLFQKNVLLAMGKFLALEHNRDIKKTYLNKNSTAMSLWDEIKRRLTFDDFFSDLEGPNWEQKHGWEYESLDLSALFGVAVENGHVTKLCLASNKCKGAKR